jgi:hypothetical protein
MVGKEIQLQDSACNVRSHYSERIVYECGTIALTLNEGSLVSGPGQLGPNFGFRIDRAGELEAEYLTAFVGKSNVRG